jgi:hypothetical protein
MRFNPYDDVQYVSVGATSVAIQSLTGSSAVNQDGIDTLQGSPVTGVGQAESLMIHVRAEIASGTPTTSTVAWKLQESNDNGVSDAFADAKDNTGTTIGVTLNVKTVAADSYARVEGIGLYNTNLTVAPFGGRKRYLRLVYTPAFTGGSSPAILVYGELIGASGNGAQLPIRSIVSNT